MGIANVKLPTIPGYFFCEEEIPRIPALSLTAQSSRLRHAIAIFAGWCSFNCSKEDLLPVHPMKLHSDLVCDCRWLQPLSVVASS